MYAFVQDDLVLYSKMWSVMLENVIYIHVVETVGLKSSRNGSGSGTVYVTLCHVDFFFSVLEYRKYL